MARLALYPTLLGAAWDTLPAPVKACHEAVPDLFAGGCFTVEHASSFVAKLVIAMAALPPAGDDIALRLDVKSADDHQIWTRHFGDFSMTTRQYLLADGRMVERRGVVELLFRVSVEDGALIYRPDGVRLWLGFPIPIPPWLGPRVAGRAWCEGDSMRVKIEVRAPLLGTIVTYGGVVTPRI